MAVIMKNIIKKKIADAISKAGFSILDFEFTPINDLNFKLVYKPEPDYNFNAANDKIFFCPGAGTHKSVSTRLLTFENAINQLNEWCKNLKIEIETIDPWKEIEKLRYDVNQINFSSDIEMFTSSDRVLIESKLDNLIKEVEKLGINSSQIKSDVLHLKEMTDKISKKDFMLLALGNLTQWVLSSIIPPEQTSSILFLFQTVLFASLILLPKSNE